METKKTKSNPYAAFKKLTIANTVIAWIEFVYVLLIAVVCAMRWSQTQPDSVIHFPNWASYVVYFGTVLLLANIGLAIAQSVQAKRIGKLANNIGYEQVICILIMLIGIALFLGEAGTYCGTIITNNPLPEWIKDAALDTHWLLYIATVCYGCAALFIAGFASYNSVLCAKVKVYKAKKA